MQAKPGRFAPMLTNGEPAFTHGGKIAAQEEVHGLTNARKLRPII
jgi:hypothetical protein